MVKCSQTFKLASAVGFLVDSQCYHRAFPNGFTRVSEVSDWVKETVCAHKGELCKQSKAGKMSKVTKKYPTHVFLSPPMPRQPPILHGAPL
jgi:hypothetical protein